MFDTSVAGDAPLTCVDPTADPNPLRCQEDQPCPAMSQPYLADLQPDGRVWALWAAEGGVELWTFDRETGVLATPLPVQADRLFVDAGGASIEVDGSIEHYELAGDAASLVRLTGTTFRMVGERILKWGGRPVVWDGSGWGLLDHAEDRIIPSSEVLVADTCAPSPGDAMATDGSVVYVQDFDGLDCRCTATACTPVSESEDAALADVYQSTWESDGVTLYVRSDDGLWFLREGVISDNLASTITVREVLVLGGQLHFTGVDANNVGGLFRVDFDGAAFSFTRVEDYGSTVVELVQVSAG